MARQARKSMTGIYHVLLNGLDGRKEHDGDGK